MNALPLFFLIACPGGDKFEPLMKISSFNPDEPTGLLLKTGTYKICVLVEDLWGAQTLYTIDQEMTVSSNLRVSVIIRDRNFMRKPEKIIFHLFRHFSEKKNILRFKFLSKKHVS